MLGRRWGFLSFARAGWRLTPLSPAMIAIAVAFWSLALHAPSARAQVYKCDNAGKTEYSDKPCVSGTIKPMKQVPGGAQGLIDFQVTTRHYPVTGDDFASALQALRVRDPSGFAGWARWKVDYQFTSEAVASGCLITAVTVRVDGEILMPQWSEEKSASSPDQASWRAMYNQLKRHEDGHIQHGREFALLLKERLMGIGAVPCEQMQSHAQKEYRQLYENLKNRDQEYDRRTDHGLR
jgi:predicted secreted Zn-dependent protease